jgi:hypothetical protein
MPTYDHLGSQLCKCPVTPVQIPLLGSVPNAYIISVADTGAEVSFVTQEIANKWAGCTNILYEEDVQVASDEGIVDSNSLTIDLIIEGYIFYNIEVVVTDEDFGVVGRNVLNQCKVELDGPNEQWTLVKC